MLERSPLRGSPYPALAGRMVGDPSYVFKGTTQEMITMQKTNPVLKEAVQKLEEAGRKNDAAVYTRAADELQKASRDQATVNLSKIQRHAEDGDTVLVPGKVLGSGRLDTDVTVAALNFSSAARKEIADAGEVVYIEDLVEENPDGEQITLMK